MTLKEYVILNVPPEKFYQDTFAEWNPRSRPNVICPFHDDNHPSMSVCLSEGGAKCHACGKAFGNIVHFHSVLTDLNEYQSAVTLYDQYIHKIIPAEQRAQYEAKISRVLSKINTELGLTKETVARFHLGFDIRRCRVSIPIFNRFGLCCNLRLYRLPSTRDDATEVKIYNEDGYGYLELFPWKSFRAYKPSEPLFWMKAERDTMLAIQEGLQAFCLTGGEASWTDEVLEVFKGYSIVIVGDNDEAGITAAEKKLNRLKSNGITAINHQLNFEGAKGKDYSDWILRGIGRSSDLLQEGRRMFREATPTSPTLRRNSIAELPDYYSEDFLHLIDLGRRSDMLNRRVKVRTLVAGKLDRTFTVPYRFHVSAKHMPKRVYTVPLGRELLELVGRSDKACVNFVRELLRAPKATIEPIEHICVCELEVIPLVTPEFESPYVSQKCFFVGEDIQTNVPYEMEIIPTNQIRSQETVGLIVRAEPLTADIINFNFTQDTLDSLNSFRPDADDTPFKSIYSLANDYSLQFSQIYNRIDWHIVAFLSWGCPLQFIFPNEGIQRGWINTLVLGDTQTGKSEVVKSLQSVTNSGAFINAENCTYVGLVGGAIKNGSGQFMLRWGKIPINNRQLVVVEELSGLSIEEISNLSEVRSSGIARLDKGGLSSETFARTRLLCLSNVRGRGRTLAGYISGVKAISDLIGHGEDISRFDFIVTLTDREVSPDVINRPRYSGNLDYLDQEDFRHLIRFIWSLKPDQIKITKAAYHLCLQKTKELATIYHPSVPIFKAGSGRLKIARIAVAMACFQFNWNGSQIIVEESHVDGAVELLQMLYDKPSCGYREYSEQMYFREAIDAESDLNQIIFKNLAAPEKRKRVFRYLLHVAKFTADELTQVAGIQIYNASEIIGRMVGSNVLRKGDANVWEITPIGKEWITKHLNGALQLPAPLPEKVKPKTVSPTGKLASLFSKRS